MNLQTYVVDSMAMHSFDRIYIPLFRRCSPRSPIKVASWRAMINDTGITEAVEINMYINARFDAYNNKLVYYCSKNATDNLILRLACMV